MFRLNAQLVVYLHREPVDFRKSINGLAALVEQGLGMDPFAPALFVFGNRRRDRVKILGWEKNGFWLLTKRLEAERFVWPRAEETLSRSPWSSCTGCSRAWTSPRSPVIAPARIGARRRAGERLARALPHLLRRFLREVIARIAARMFYCASCRCVRWPRTTTKQSSSSCARR